MKTYLQHDPATGTIIELVEKREYDKLLELAETRRQTAQNYYQQSLASEDRATKNLREVERLEQANAELIERLAEARESHLAASARDVQTIQRQAIMLERLADALEKMLYIIGDPSAKPDKLWRTDDEVNEAYHTSLEALAAYESANLEPANPIDETVRRMEAVPMYELDEIWFTKTGLEWDFDDALERIRARLIQAAKGEQP